MDVRIADVVKLLTICGATPTGPLVHRLLSRSGSTLQETQEQLSYTQRATKHDIFFERKLHRAQRVSKLLSYLPFVRAIAVCNSLGFQTAHEHSDIDLFIVAAPQRVWTARLFVAAALRLLHLRPQEAARDPVCASFFVDETVTDLSHLMIERDIYFFVWQRALLPLFGTHALYALAARTAPHARVEHKKMIQRIGESCARVVSESAARRAQWAQMPDELRAAAARPGTDVVCTSGIIKLHLNDRRAALRDAVYAV